MAEMRTRRTEQDVAGFLASVADPRRRADAERVCALMSEVTGDTPAMWGSGIVGFGRRHLVYATGRELDWFDIGFSPRKAATTLYLTDGFDAYADVLARLGPHTTGKGCLYVKRLEDLDPDALRELLAAAVAAARGA
ncbi:DUF1801 domain-containing protein [Georgenia wangjunii]|uniref:DUF1801 domain-containing protein n=1 Tax=Georgenia wangjunii TaxID=3117730 RepID=UPI002F25EBC6